MFYRRIVSPICFVLIVIAGCKAPARKTSGVDIVSESSALHSIPVTAADIDWPESDPESPDPHTVFGEPIYTLHDDAVNVTRTYGAFTTYYDDVILAPRWTAIKMTAEVADNNGEMDRLGEFSPDTFLTEHGFDFTEHDHYNNLPGFTFATQWDRGHMVQFDDARGYGDQAGIDSFLTTNVCPQLASLNQRGWLSLEETTTEFARDYVRLWIYTGPIYDDDPQPSATARGVIAPTAFYKIVVREDEDGGVAALAFIIPQTAVPRGADLAEFIVKIDEVEDRTDIDFLHELPDDLEDALETAVPVLWPDLE